MAVGGGNGEGANVKAILAAVVMAVALSGCSPLWLLVLPIPFPDATPGSVPEGMRPEPVDGR